MRRPAAKFFEFEEGSTERMYYRIVVYFKEREIERFETPTQLEAYRQFELAGYKRVGTDGV
jgi:hypothetical protein